MFKLNFTSQSYYTNLYTNSNSHYALTKPTVTKQTVIKPTVTKPTVTKPTVTKPTVTKPTVTKPTVTKPMVTKPIFFNIDKINHNTSLKRKMYIANNILYNPLFSISKLSNILYHKCNNINNVLLIGNGSIYNDISNTIQDYDIVVRFNNYISDNPIELVGTKTDIHLTCIPNDLDDFNSWDNGCDCIIPLEINFQERYDKLIKMNKNSRVIIPDITFMKNIKNTK